MYTLTNSSFYLDGIPLHVREVTRSLGEVHPATSGHFVRGSAPDYTTVNCFVQGWGSDIYACYRRIWDEVNWRESNVCALGSGRICPYCGDYNPAATTICWRCKGKTEESEFATPRQASVSISFLDGIPRYYVDDDDDRLREFNIELIVRHADASVLTHLLTGSAHLLPTSFSLDTGFYLCQYCGTLVAEGSVCPFCGGQRLPWMEVLHLKRECVYCGNKVTGGIICHGCAARISGITFRQWKESQ